MKIVMNAVKYLFALCVLGGVIGAIVANSDPKAAADREARKQAKQRSDEEFKKSLAEYSAARKKEAEGPADPIWEQGFQEGMLTGAALAKKAEAKPASSKVEGQANKNANEAGLSGADRSQYVRGFTNGFDAGWSKAR